MTESTEPAKRHFYQAIGIVEGQLDIDGVQGQLLIGKATYPASSSPKTRLKHQPGQSQHFKVYPNVQGGRLTFNVINIVNEAPPVFTLKGCWEIHHHEPRFVIYRNPLQSKNSGLLSIPLSLDWDHAPPPDGQFWELEAALNGSQFTVLKTNGPFTPPRKAIPSQDWVKAPKADLAKQPVAPPRLKAQGAAPPAPPAIALPPATSLTIQEIRDMATPAKVQLTCKLNQVPAYRDRPDKQVEFFLSDGNDRIFTVRMKPKLFKKLIDHGYEQWVAAITGELGPATETGFELLNPTIQMFEKKTPVDAPTEQANAPSTASNLPSDKAAQGSAVKRKNLLDGVRMK
jgi:hypothetical protein